MDESSIKYVSGPGEFGLKIEKNFDRCNEEVGARATCSNSKRSYNIGQLD